MLANSDGTGVRALTQPLLAISGADWSGDGQFVVVAYEEDDHPTMGPRVDMVYRARPGLPVSSNTGAGMLITEFRAVASPYIEKSAGAGAKVERLTVVDGGGDAGGYGAACPSLLSASGGRVPGAGSSA